MSGGFPPPVPDLRAWHLTIGYRVIRQTEQFAAESEALIRRDKSMEGKVFRLDIPRLPKR